MKKLTFLALIFSTSLTAALAASNKGVLVGECVISAPQELDRIFKFNLESDEYPIGSNEFTVKVPLNGANEDIYSIIVTNTVGLVSATRNQDVIEIGINKQRTFCNPPQLGEKGHVFITPCSRPENWENLSGRTRVQSPQDGDVITLDDQTEQIAVFCKALFKTL